MKKQTDEQVSRTRLSWSDFHTIWVVSQHGQLAKASVALAVTHATLLRKLAAIEARLGARLFDRERGQYSLTNAGEQIVLAAEEFAPVARDAELRILGQDMHPSGHVRVTTVGLLIDYLLPPLLAQFASAFPDVQIELAASRDLLSLARRDADVAIRITDTAPAWLVGRQLARLSFKVYGLKRPGFKPQPCPVAELFSQRRWISFERDSQHLKFDRWLHRHVPDTSVCLRVDNFGHALSMVKAGLGIALLPAFLERTCPEIQPLTECIEELRTPLWVLTHQELRNAMRIKVITSALGPALKQILLDDVI
jgi:DNA-binding transcriptional LysR family regulator